MTSITITNLDDNYYELKEEFRKLASIVPIIPKDQCLSELELIEFVIIYIRQLQRLLSYNQLNEHIYTLTSSIKDSLSSSSSDLVNQLIFQSPKIQINENLLTINRNPLVTINLDNIQLS